jgi:hypothetical protein
MGATGPAGASGVPGTGGSTSGFPTFIQTSAPGPTDYGAFTKYVWVDSSTSPPTINVQSGSDVPTTTLPLVTNDDLLILNLMGAL